MNARAAEALYAAEAAGVKQIKGGYWSWDGGRCALGVVAEALIGTERLLKTQFTVADFRPAIATSGEMSCPCCQEMATEFAIVYHLNDHHGLTFAEIARKMGPDSV